MCVSYALRARLGACSSSPPLQATRRCAIHAGLSHNDGDDDDDGDDGDDAVVGAADDDDDDDECDDIVTNMCEVCVKTKICA